MRGAPQVYTDFSGGVNLDAAPYLLEDNQARDALNVHADALTGQIRKRNGIVQLADLSLSPAFTEPAHSLAAFNLDTPVLVAVGSIGGEDKMVSVNTAGGVADVTGTTTLTEDTRWSFAQADLTSGGSGPVFAMNGVDPPQVWDGTGAFADWAADAGTLPATGNFITYAGGRLWCAELAENGRIRYSDITGTAPDTGNWDADAFVDLDPSDGESITGIGKYGPYLFVFKPTKTYVITDLVTGANRTLSTRVGTVSPRSIVETDIGLMWWDIEQGIYSTNGSKMQRLSANIEPLLRDAGEFPDLVQKAAATFVDGRYQLSLSRGGNTPDITAEYDTRSKAWWLHDFAVNDWAVLDPEDNPTVYAVDANAIRAQEMFVHATFTDAGETYTGGAYFTGAHHTWNEPHLSKRVREVRVDGSGNWRLGYATNFERTFTYEDGEVWDTTEEAVMLFAPSPPDGHLFAPTIDSGDLFAPTNVAVTDRRYHTLGVARAWSFKILNDDSGDFQLFSETIAIGTRAD